MMELNSLQFVKLNKANYIVVEYSYKTKDNCELVWHWGFGNRSCYKVYATI